MLKSILEKILQKFLGEYLYGIDSMNLSLGVWSGNICLENLLINPRLFEGFPLPFSLIFSHIGKMRLYIPWNKLSSAAVEIFIEKVSIILRVQPQSEWVSAEERSFLHKTRALQRTTELFLKKLAVKHASFQREIPETYIEGFTRLILDNLQINIKEIHLRVEDSAKKLAFGAFLSLFAMQTADESWKKGFLRRNKDENAIHKLFSLENLMFYCNERELHFHDFLQRGDETAFRRETLESLKKIADLRENLVFSLSLSAKIRRTRDFQEKNPEIQLFLEVKTLDFCVNRQQMRQFLSFLASCHEFQIFAETAVFAEEVQFSQNFASFKETFAILAETRDYFNEKTAATPSSFAKFKQIVAETPQELLKKWAKQTLKELHKQRFLEDLQKNSNKSWFSLNFCSFWSQKSYISVLSAEEVREFLDFFEESAKEPSKSETFSAEIRLSAGSLSFLQETSGVRFTFQGFSLDLQASCREKLQFRATLKEFFAEIRAFRDEKPVFFQVFARDPRTKAQNLLNLQYFREPCAGELLEVAVCESELVHDPRFWQNLRGFFALEDGFLKENARKTLHDTQLSLENSLKARSFLEIRCKLSSPSIIFPFLHDNSQNNECWILRPGDFYLTFDPKREKELYELSLKKIRLQYFASIRDFRSFSATNFAETTKAGLAEENKTGLAEENKTGLAEKNKTGLAEENKTGLAEQNKTSLAEETNTNTNFAETNTNTNFAETNTNTNFAETTKTGFAETLVEEFEILVFFEKLRQESAETPQFRVNIAIPALNLHLSQQIYKKLLQFPRHLGLGRRNREEIVELAHNERVALLEKAVKIGEVLRKTVNLLGVEHWSRFFAVLSGNYLYFFEKQRDFSPAANFYLKNSRVFEVEDRAKPHVLQLSNNYADLFLAFEKAEQKASWLQIFAKYYEKTQKPQPIFCENCSKTEKNYSLKKLALEFRVNSMKLTLHPLIQQFPLIFCANSLFLKTFVQEDYASTQISLDSLKIQDFLAEAPLKRTVIEFLSHESLENHPELIEFQLISKGYAHPQYSGVHSAISLDLGHILVNYNRETMEKLHKFFEKPAKTREKAAFLQENKRDWATTFAVSLKKLAFRFESRGNSCENAENRGNSCENAENRGNSCENAENRGKLRRLFEISLRNGSLHVLQKTANFIEIAGKLGNLQVFDQFSHKFAVEILGLEHDKSSLCEFFCRSLEDTILLEMTMNSVKFDAYFPSILQAVAVIRGDLLAIFKGNREKTQENPQETSQKSFKLSLKVFSPLLVFRPHLQDFSQYFLVNLGQIELNFCRNRAEYAAKLVFQEMDAAYFFETAKFEEFLNPLQISLQISRDSQLFVDFSAKITAICVNLSRNSLVFLKEVLQNNVFSALSRKKAAKTPQNPQDFRRKLQLDVESLNVFWLKRDSQGFFPVFLVILRPLRLIFAENVADFISFAAHSLVVTYFSRKTADFLEEYSFVGHLSRKTHEIRDFTEIREISSALLRESSREGAFLQPNISISLKIESNCREISLKLADLRINLLLDAVSDVFSALARENLGELQNFSREKAEFSQKTEQNETKTAVFLAELENCSIILPCCDSQTLNLAGNAGFSAEISQNPSSFRVKTAKIKDLQLFFREKSRNKHILQPLDAIFTVNEQLFLLEIGRFFAEIAYFDILLLQKTLEKHASELAFLQKSRVFSKESAPPSDFSLQIRAKTVQIVLNFDVSGLFSPFFLTNLRAIDAFLRRTAETVRFSADFQLSCAYFNYFAGVWEPLCELCELELEFLQKRGPFSQETSAFLRQTHAKTLELNVPTRFLALITRVRAEFSRNSAFLATFLQESFSKHEFSQRKRLSLQISPHASFEKNRFSQENLQKVLFSRHIVRNNTGYSLTVDSFSRKVKTAKIQNLEEASIFFEKAFEKPEFSQNKSQEQQSFSEICGNGLKISLKFEVTPEICEIAGVSLDRVTCRTLILRRVRNALQQFTLFSRVELQESTGFKVLTLCSPLILRNLAHKTLEIRLISAEKPQSFAATLQNLAEMHVPFDLVRGNLLIKLEKSLLWSPQISLQALLCGESAVFLENGLLVRIFAAKSCEFPGDQRQVLSFRASFELFNHLPWELELEVAENRENRAVFLAPGAKTAFFFAEKGVFLRARVHKFAFSQEFAVSAGGSPLRRKLLKLCSETASSQFLQLVLESFENRHCFFAETLVFNDTQLFLRLSGGESLERCEVGPQETVGFSSETLEINENRKEIGLLSGLGAQHVEVSAGIAGEIADLLVEARTIALDELHNCLRVTLSPKYVFLNNLEESVFAKDSQNVREFKAQTREPLLFSQGNPLKKLSFAVQHSSFSSSFEATSLGLHYFSITFDSPRQALPLKLDTSLTNASVFLSLSKVAEASEPFEVLNDTADYSLRISQTPDQRFSQQLAPQTSLRLVPIHAGAAETLRFAFLHKLTGREMLQGSVPLSSLNSQETAKALGNGFFYQETLGSRRKTLRFMDKSSRFLQPGEGSIKKSSFFCELRLKYVGVSLISNSRDGRSPHELCYFLLENLQCSLLQTSDHVRRLAVSLENLQLQNNSGFCDHFPVILRKAQRKASPSENPWILRVFVQQTNADSQELLTLQDVRVEFSELKVCLEACWKQLCADFFKELATCARVPAPQANPAESSWRTAPVFSRKKDVYIINLVISSIFLNISYKSSPELSSTALRNLYKSLANFENIEFSLPGLLLSHLHDNKSTLCENLLLHFKENFTYDILKVLGCIEILGNPAGLWKHLSTGFRDFLEKPFEEGGKGLFTGMTSLLNNTLTGTFDSVNKISSSFGNSFAALSFDAEFQRNRLKDSRASAAGTPFAGIQGASVSIFKGFEHGITDVFLKPLQGAQEQGLRGLFKGTFQGIAGFFAKPIAGLLDATSKTAEGLRNLVSSAEACKQQLRGRRPFYGLAKVYKEFSQQDSEILEFLEKFKNGRYAKMNFFDFVKVGEPGKDFKFLVMMVETLLLLSVKKRKKEWEIETKKIKRVERESAGVCVFLKEKNKRIEGLSARIPTFDAELQDYLYEDLLSLMEINKDL